MVIMNQITFYKYSSFDATRSKGIGKYVNHSKRHYNAKAKLVDSVICIFATKDLEKGIEIRYDYGDSNLSWKVVFYFVISFY